MTTARETTKEKNARFGGLTPAQQRVAIARDALAWIKAGALVPTMGVYLNPTTDRARHVADSALSSVQLRDVRLGKCKACALGAMLAAKAVRFDAVTVGDWRGDPHYKLAEHFDEPQIALIEAAFEQRLRGPYYGRVTNIEAADAIAFGERHAGDGARLRAILGNIIANGGTFKPEARP